MGIRSPLDQKEECLLREKDKYWAGQALIREFWNTVLRSLRVAELTYGRAVAEERAFVAEASWTGKQSERGKSSWKCAAGKGASREKCERAAVCAVMWVLELSLQRVTLPSGREG